MGDKAILVLDEMPEKCMDCPCFDFDVCYCNITDRKVIDAVNSGSKPDWYPIRSIPKKEDECFYDHGYEDKFAYGWNRCIDAITGGGKDG